MNSPQAMASFMNSAVTQEAAVVSATGSLPPHLVKIPGEQWAFWRWICLRSAGFPFDLPLQLATPAIVTAINHLFSLEQSVADKIDEDIAALRLLLDNTTDQAHRKSLQRARKQLNKGKVPGTTGTAADRITQELAILFAQQEEAKVQFTSQFQIQRRELSTKIRRIAANSEFRQAILLQNRAALPRVMAAFAARKDAANHEDRRREELVARYLQRYCLKNDTIGFFGPVGWAKLVDGKDPLSVRPGPALLSRSSLYFENWCIEALAEKISAIKSLRPWFAPRLLPFFRLETGVLYCSGPASHLSAVHAAILERCNGESTAREIAQTIIAMPGYGLRTEGQVYGILQAYAARGIISWALELPFCLHPEQKLQELLEKIEREELRRPLLEELLQLENVREKICRAAGDPKQLENTLSELDDTFTRLTNRSATRSAGAMYASRTLVYQDCRRDVQVEIGPELVASLGAPLSLLLNSARWFTYQAAAAYRNRFREIYEELAQQNNSPKVDLLQFWARIEALIFDPAQKLFNEVVPEFQNRWEAILRVDWDKHRMEYASAILKPMVKNLFAVPSAGWQFARYQSPDVMIAAPNVEAIRRGDYMFVLGEVHMAENTLRFSFFVSQHDKPEELFEAFQTDLPQPRVVPVPPRHWPRITNRTSPALTSPQDYYLEVSSAPVANAPRSRVVPAAGFAVEHSGESLSVRSWDGRLKFDVIEFVSELLSHAAIEMVKIVRPRPHMPRITIDNLVVARESWSFPVSELDFVHPETEHERFLAVRRWMHRNNLPRLVFVRVRVEVKPFYLDFDSPVYVEIFIKMMRRMLSIDSANGRVTLTEMLPTPEQVWLPDADGRVYTSEFRIVAWDLAN
ncbi:MAG TPA: lantibiotic dehydratase [Candidatus Angelobacter sp.]